MYPNFHYIDQYNEKYKRIKQNDLINHFSRELKLERPISKITMSEILQENEYFFFTVELFKNFEIFRLIEKSENLKSDYF